MPIGKSNVVRTGKDITIVATSWMVVEALRAAEILKKNGVNIEIVDPNDIKSTTEAYKRALNFKGTSAVISKSPCILLENRDKRRRGEKINLYEIDQGKCKRCKTCIGRFGCPAIYFGEDESVNIDLNQCNGCGNCATICPFEAIHIEEDK